MKVAIALAESDPDMSQITIAENDPHMPLRLKLLSDPAESDPDKSDPDRVPDVSSL